MPQGKLKVKAKVPKSVEAKRKAKKGPAISKRGSAPAAKKAKKAQVEKLKKVITKTVNAAAEEEIRAIALDGKKSLLTKKGSTTTKAAPKNKKGKKK